MFQNVGGWKVLFALATIGAVAVVGACVAALLFVVFHLRWV